MVGALNLNDRRNKWCSTCRTMTNHTAENHPKRKESMMHHRPPDALKFGIINRDDIGPGVYEVVWPNGDRSCGKTKRFLLKSWVRRMWRLKRVI